jgi:hypothetical protein
VIRITIECGFVEGKSTLAAVLLRALGEVGIPARMPDDERSPDGAEGLLGDTERFRRNCGAIAGRLDAMRDKVVVVTRTTAAPFHTASRKEP